MNVLSLFDGMSCGQLALQRAGIKYEKYFASEVDKYAIQIAKKNFPDTIHVGDVTKVRAADLPKINLLIGGSPCQGFSFAGKQLNFNDPRSALFFEFVRIKKELGNVKFLLENVVMKKEYQDVISELLGVKPILINSALVSAQNRKRLYWTNIEGVTQPEDKGILLKDIIEDAVTEKDKSYCIDANYWKGASFDQYLDKCRRRLVFKQQCSEGSQSLKRMIKNTKAFTEKSGCLTASMFKGMASNGCTNVVSNYTYRSLTPIECERLQTLPDNYTEGVSNTQRYKMIGNGWTVDVIAHIFKHLERCKE